MALPLRRDDKDFLKIVAMKQAVSSSVMTAGVRLGDGSLRKKTTDKLGALLEEVKAAEELKKAMED